MDVKLNVPKEAITADAAGNRVVQYYKIAWVVDGDGKVEVPAWAAEELLARGLTLDRPQAMGLMAVEAQKFDTLDELRRADDGELHTFLRAHGESEITFDKFTHMHSEWLRRKGRETPDIVKVTTMEDGKEKVLEEERFTAIAEHLDTFHRALHMRSQGRIVVQPAEKVREFALAIQEAVSKGEKKPPCPWAKTKEVVEEQPQTAADLAKTLREKKQ